VSDAVAADEADRPPIQPPSPFDTLRDRRAIVDAGLGPIVFVTVNAIAGLNAAAAAAVAVSVLVVLERAVRRANVTNAIGGVLGTGLAVFIALRSGAPEGYFVPRMLYMAALAVVFAGSVVVRRPLISYIARALQPAPAEWWAHPKVRRTFSEVTLAWAGLFAVRAIVYAIFIAMGKVGFLAAASIVLGWPAFLGLAWLSYRYVPRRLAQLGAPPHPHHRPKGAEPEAPERPTATRDI
jgi:hypothetical protein